jgi:hypothetical protein
MAEHIEIMATSLDEQLPIPSKGKNITQMKEIYKENKSKEIPKPRPRKHKRASPIDETALISPTESETKTQIDAERPTKDPPLGPGRPTKDDALLREANNNDDSDNNNAQMAMREVQLFFHNGTVRKKIKILTKYPENIKCFAIKHYTSYEYVANERKKALEKIKELRTTLKSLQYIETNLEPYIKDMSAF